MPNKRFKVTCALCNKVFDNDYRGKHCKAAHPNYNANTLPLVNKKQTKLFECLNLLIVQNPPWLYSMHGEAAYTP